MDADAVVVLSHLLIIEPPLKLVSVVGSVPGDGSVGGPLYGCPLLLVQVSGRVVGSPPLVEDRLKPGSVRSPAIPTRGRAERSRQACWECGEDGESGR